MRLLLAEDERTLADWLVRALVQSDFVVDRVDDGRLERVGVAEEPGPKRMQARMITSMYLGDRWEYLFESSGLRLRAFGHQPREAGRDYWLDLPAEACWAYAA